MLTKLFLHNTKERLLSQKLELASKFVRRPDIDMDGDETDEIQGNMLIEIHNQLSTRDGRKLLQVEDALKRIDDNTYGVCQDCGDSIPEKRLLVNPYFLTCVSCAESRERQDKQRKRF